MDQVTEQETKLPSGYEKVGSKSDWQLKVKSDFLPWLPTRTKEGRPILEHRLQLTEIVLSGGTRFYLGSLIAGDELVEAANSLDKHRSQIVNKMFYAHLPGFLRKDPVAKRLDDAVTKEPIYYFSNKGGQRVYFIGSGEKQGKPVIIRIAVCDKSEQAGVLGVLTINNQTYLRRSIA